MVPASLDTTYKNKSRHRIYITMKMNSKWLIGLDVKHKTTKLLENKR